MQGLPYDYESIMHYGNTAFSIDGVSKTMERKVDSQIPIINAYDKTRLSDLDVQAVRLRYNCL